MKRNDKKAKNKQGPKKDKDIHLNVVGVPPKNVNVNKTKPIENNEEYQLYRISIDTSGKEKERKHRMGSLEPSSNPKKIKNRKRYKSNDSSILSSDSELESPRPRRPKTSGGRTQKPSGPRATKREEVDNEICFTIPGEKGKAIKIVGSSTKHRNDGSTSSSKGKKSSSSGRQVEFAGLDEVYGTTPEGSLASYEASNPYDRASPQVYNVENTSPSVLFTGKTKNSHNPRLSDTPNSEGIHGTLFDNQKKAAQAEDVGPYNRVHRTGSRMLDQGSPSSNNTGDKPKPLTPPRKQTDDSGDYPYSNYSRPDPISVSRGDDTASSTLPNINHNGSNYSGSGIAVEGKGKYPYYPYDKQKRGKAPTEQPHLHTTVNNQDESLGKKEPFSHHILPSIPEVRSTEHASGPTEVGGVPENVSVLGGTTGQSHDVDESSSSLSKRKDNVVPTNFSKPIKTQNGPNPKEKTEPIDKLDQHPIPNDFKAHKEINQISKSTSPLNLKVDKEPSKHSLSAHHNMPSNSFNAEHTSFDHLQSIPPQKNLHSIPTIRQRESLAKTSAISGNMKSVQTQKSTQVNTSHSPLQSKVQENSVNPVLNGENGQSQKESITKKKLEPLNKYEPRLESKAAVPLESSKNRLLKEGSPKGNPKFAKDSNGNTKQNHNDKREPLKNKTSSSSKRPETVNKEIMTEIPNEAKEKIMLEIASEISKKPSPSSKKSNQTSYEHKTPGVEKDSKSKSKILTFVSSIPKPLFRRHKSPTSQVNKTTGKSDQIASEKPKDGLPNRSPYPSQGKSNIGDEIRKPVVESSIVKRDHAPKVEAYPAWITSPESKSHQGNLKSHSSSGSFNNEATKFTASRHTRREPVTGGATDPADNLSQNYLPHGITDESPSIEIANRSYGEHPLVRDTYTSPRGSKQIISSALASEEEDQHNLRHDDMLKEIGSGSWKSLTDEKPKNFLHSDQNDIHNPKFAQGSAHKDGKGYNNFEGANILAYPGRVDEKTPFGYDSQLRRDPNEETQALKSLEDTHRGKQNISKMQLYDGKSDPKSDLVHPMSKENYGNKADDKQQQKQPNSTDYSKALPSSSKDILKPDTRGHESLREMGFNQLPVENTVYVGQVPDQTYKVFHAMEPKEEPNPSHKKDFSPLYGGQGPKGILIFVNKKNETASPFEKNKNTPSSKKGKNPKTNKKQEGSKKKRLSQDTTSLSGTSLTATSAQSSNTKAGGDKHVTLERSPSGRKTTQKYPCGCIRVIVSDPKNQQKREDLISAYCRKGSQCDVRNPNKKQQREDLSTHTGRSDQSSRTVSKVSSKGRHPGKTFPDVEVVADGVLSRRPIKHRAPAPTMNGANLTGTINIKSNKFNGVYNFYLDRKLKSYLRNNMDKLKQLLDDDHKR